VTAAPLELRGLERLDRATFTERLAAQWEPGDHLAMIGPTHRGKSTLLAKVLPATNFDAAVLLCPKGPDPAYAKLGARTRSWPPRRQRLEVVAELFGWPAPTGAEEAARPRVWKFDTLPLSQKPADWQNMREAFAKVLGEAVNTKRKNSTKTKSLLIVVDDSRLVCDPRRLRLEAEVVTGLIVGRSKRVSIANMFQAPRWVPREGLDQITQGLVWNNEDRDVAMRLSEVSGYDPRQFMAWLRGLDNFHECLWFDVKHRTIAVVESA
jgi:hypothetical protein